MSNKTFFVTFTGDFAANHADDLQTWLRSTFVDEAYSVSAVPAPSIVTNTEQAAA